MAWKAIIVEDEELLREGMAEFMDWDAMGFTIEGTAENGAAGLDLALQVHPDVVLSDIRMPVMDGLEMLEHIRQFSPDILAVIISGYDEFDYARGAMRLGVEDYLLKPIQPDQVETIMKKMADKLEARRQDHEQREQLLRIKDHSVSEMSREWIGTQLFNTQPSDRLDEMLRIAGWDPENYVFQMGIVEYRDFSSLSLDCDFMQVMELDQQFREECEKRLARLSTAQKKDMQEAFLQKPGTQEAAPHNTEMQRADAPGPGIQKVDADQAADGLYVYYRGSGEAVVVCCGQDPDQVQQQSERVQKALAARNALQMQFLLSFGPALTGAMGLQDSRRSAEHLREAAYLKLWQEESRAKGRTSAPAEVSGYDVSLLFNTIRDGDHAKLDREYARFAQAIEQEKLRSKVHMMYVVSGLFTQLIALPQEIGMSFEQALGDPMQYYSDIVGRERVTDILAGIHTVCDKLTDLFASSGASQAGIALRRAIEYIEQSYANPGLLMADVAGHAFISSTYLGILLKKETGKTFVEYLTEYRMQQARHLLLESELKNYEVAERCGFSDPTYFSTVFKKVYGMSPSAFRKSQT